MKKKIIQAKNVFFKYNLDYFLKDICFDVYKGDFLGIIGPNGGGKTTILKLLLGFLKPNKGDIFIFSKNPKESRKHIGYLSQFKDIDFDFPITAFEIALMGRFEEKIIKKFTDKDKKAVEKTFKKLGIFHLKDKKLNELSGGEKQRVFVSRAICNNPKILILDEPLTNLDMYIQEDFYKLLKKLNKKMTIIIVDHDLEILKKYTNRVICVNKCKTDTIKQHIMEEINV